MIRNSFKILIVAIFAWFLYSLFSGYQTKNELNKTAYYYNSNEVKEVGAANVVTAIVVTYRGLDTLGEVTVLFLTASIIGFILQQNGKNEHNLTSAKSKSPEILETGAKILVPGSMILGIYIFINGHLTPGGGFQGGSVIGSAMLLLFMANPKQIVSHKVMQIIESTSGFFYVIIGILGLILAGGFLDNRILPLGHLGSLLSAGVIPIIYSLIGLKVGAEISGMVKNINETETNESL